MELEMLEKGKDKMSFIVRNIDSALINAIRRCAIEEVPTMAIEDVEFRKNNSALYDEIIAHRLGLIPLKTDLESYNTPEKCKCNGAGCAMCQLKITLQATSAGVVYASELKSKDPKVKPAYPQMPIAKLIKGQRLELEATATLGKGKEHMKWSPGLAYYKHLPAISVTKKVSNPEDVAANCPKKIFEAKGNRLAILKDKITECHFCSNCEKSSNGAVKIEKPDEYIFYVESWGQLSQKEIIAQAADEFLETIKNFEKEIKK
jgi:DNA-directed RNA polymerase subunit D